MSGDVSSKPTVKEAPTKEEDAAAKAADREAEEKAKEEAKIAAAEKKEGESCISTFISLFLSLHHLFYLVLS